MGYFNRLKDKWAVESNLQLIIIFVVFAITGSSSVKIAKPLLELMGVEITAFEDIFMGSSTLLDTPSSNRVSNLSNLTALFWNDFFSIQIFLEI